jgi:predicted RNA-binding protein YlqC (UPF0109 family)
MKELVTFLVKSLADHPDKVSVDQSEQNGSLHLKLNVAEEDKGKIIGKQGKVIKAIRAVVSAAAVKSGKRTSVDID